MILDPLRPPWILITALWAGVAGGQAAYEMEPVVPRGSPFHGVHGLRFNEAGDLYAVSVIGQSVFTVDVATGTIERLVGPPAGMGDDIAIAPDGTLVWTAIEDGIVYARAPDGSIRRLWEGRRGVNAVSFSPSGERLFVSLVFYGDALYELDLDGDAAPRLIAEDIGGLNAFEVGDDGMIYGPLLFAGRVVRIDPDTGVVETISDELEGPGALKLGSAGEAFVLDEGGELKRVDLASGAVRLVTVLPHDADNLALDARGRIHVSMAAVNAIAAVDPATGEYAYVIEPAPLNSPAGFAIEASGGGDRLYVGDLFAGIRIVDADSGAIMDTPVELFQPAHLDVAGSALLAVSEVFGIVQRLDRTSFAVLAEWDGFASPSDVLATPDGGVVVAETGAGRIVEISGREADAARRVVADDLAAPRGLAWAGERAVYATETDAGRLLRIELDSGAERVVADGLARPEGVAVGRRGRIVVAEVGARRLLGIEAASGRPSVIADGLPIGLSEGPSLYRAVETSDAGAIYFNSDIDNTIYRLTPR